MSEGGPGPVDSVLLIGFGGPTRSEEILPFLRRVSEGRGVPEDRLLEVARHYEAVGGRSPYNDLAAGMAGRLREALSSRGLRLPVSLGMRNSAPWLKDALAAVTAQGGRHAAGVILAAHRSPASWQRYMQDVAAAMDRLEGPRPAITYLDACFADPHFLEACARRIEEGTGYRRGGWPPEVPLIFTAHSIPTRTAGDSTYVADLLASCRGVAGLLEVTDWRLAYQSRSGDPRTPWLSPDIGDLLRERAAAGARRVVLHAIGFLMDHVEVLYDLDQEAAALARELGMTLHRTPCVGSHPVFIDGIARRIAAMAAGAG